VSRGDEPGDNEHGRACRDTLTDQRTHAGGVPVSKADVDLDRLTLDLSCPLHAVEEAFRKRASTLLSATEDHYYAGPPRHGLGPRRDGKHR